MNSFPLAPTGTEARVCYDIAARQLRGVTKYGVTVEENPLSLKDWLNHAYQETLDNAVYLRRAIEKIDAEIFVKTVAKPTCKGWWWHRYLSDQWMPRWIESAGCGPEWLLCRETLMSSKADDWKGDWVGPLQAPSVPNATENHLATPSSQKPTD